MLTRSPGYRQSEHHPSLTVNADGAVHCPDCQTDVSVGKGGIKNYDSQHFNSKKCRANLAAKTRKAKSSLNMKSLTSFFSKKPATTIVPSTVKAPSLVTTGHQGINLEHEPTSSSSNGILHGLSLSSLAVPHPPPEHVSFAPPKPRPPPSNSHPTAQAHATPSSSSDPMMSSTTTGTSSTGPCPAALRILDDLR